jgi:drug/metabolite transporter (DMT)-like permease
MRRRDLAELLLLGALWGASFLFMRMGAVEFGALALVFVRVGVAAAMLLPLLAWQGQWPALREHWRPIALVGVFNSALPFLCFAIAAYVLSAGLMGVFNATAPIWTALVAWAWLGDRPGRARSMGLAFGLAGAIGLAWSRASFKDGSGGITPALGIAACLLATLLYGVGANYTRRKLTGVPPMATAAGSQLSATLVLALPAWWAWPAQAPSTAAWASALALALLCTGFAYILYFRLIANAGATNAVAVTFLIPAFAMAWGWLVLGERPGWDMLAGTAMILLGTGMTVGLIRLPAALEKAKG